MELHELGQDGISKKSNRVLIEVFAMESFAGTLSLLPASMIRTLSRLPASVIWTPEQHGKPY